MADTCFTNNMTLVDPLQEYAERLRTGQLNDWERIMEAVRGGAKLEATNTGILVHEERT